MERRVVIGAAVLIAGVALVLLADRMVPPEETAPVEEPVGVGSESVSLTGAAAPLTLMPAESIEDAAVEHGALRGRVVSWGDGVGVAGAEVTFAHGGATHALQTGSGGGFELVAIEPGRYELAVVSAEGYLPFAPEWGHSPVVFHARPRQRIAGITIYLTPAVLYRGQVQSPAGEPVAGATVRVVGEEGAGLSLAPALEPVASDLVGEFAIAAPDFALLEASHPEWTPGRARVDFAAQVSHRLHIRLGARADDTARFTIAGRVVAVGGAPVDGAVVEARFAAANPAAPAAQLRTTGRAATDANGEFAVVGLDAGTYALTASARGHAPAYRPVVRAGTRDVVLHLSYALALRGAVTDANTGEPVPTFALLLSATRGRQRVESVLDAAGAYQVNDLGAATYRVRVAAYGYATTAASEVTLVAAQREPAVLDFELTAGGRVHGVVIDEGTRSPLAGARVSCETGLRARDAVLPIAASGLTDARGRFELRGVATGLRSLVVAAAGHHGRIISGLQVEDDGDIGPLTIELAQVVEGEQPRLELTGIGAVLSPQDDGYVIGETLAGGGALAAGLVSGDIIIAIDGTPVSDLDFRDGIEMIRGAEGSRLTLTVRKAESGEEVEVEATRRRVRR